MEQVQLVAPISAALLQDASRIPALTHEEALRMSTEELGRFLALIESLSDEDWNQPTACSLWSVKDIVAHQAAHVTSLISLRRFLSQLNPLLMRPYRSKGMDFLDAWNQSQVDLRRTSSPAELVDEIRRNGPRSLSGRDRVPAFVRAPKLPLPGLDQPRSPGYLFDLIYTRDMWMHRHDICSATMRPMDLDANHDGRVVALVVRDLAEKSAKDMRNLAAILELAGPSGGSYRLGADEAPLVSIEMDALDFCVLTSGRDRADNVLAGSQVVIHGAVDEGENVVRYFENRVLY